MKFFKNGFTLAEVLITLTIIGIVAATTLPSLNSNINNRALETQVKKLHNTLTNAVASYLTEQGAESLSDLSSFNADNFVTQYLKPISKCRTSTATGCMQVYYGNYKPDYTYGKTYILNDGIVICILGNIVRTSDFGQISPYIQVLADINGPKKPNKMGYDTFRITIRNDGSIDDYSLRSASTVLSATKERLLNYCKSSGDCYGYLLRNGFKIDY